MNDSEIGNYIKKHGKWIESALRVMKGRVPLEEIEDARQELCIVMLECLRKYDPLRNDTFDAYVNKSVRKKARGLFEDYILRMSPRVGKDKKVAHVISMQAICASDEGEEYFGDSIADETEMVELLDARLLNDDLMSGLSPEIREIVTEWSEHETLKAIGKKHAMSYETVRGKIRAALEEMRTLVDDEKRSRRLL